MEKGAEIVPQAIKQFYVSYFDKVTNSEDVKILMEMNGFETIHGGVFQCGSDSSIMY